MVVTPVYAGYVPTYVSREPYLTVDEYLAAPTGTDTTQLLPGGSPAQNRDALTGVIQRASSEADVCCQQVLAATVDVQTAPPEGWRVQRDRAGRLVVQVPVDYTPVVAVTGVELGSTPASVAALTDLTGVWPSRKVVTVPVAALSSTPPGTTMDGLTWPGAAGGRRWGNITYISGYFNATLGSAAAVGATSVTPSDVLGLYPGLQFTIYDTRFSTSEMCTVDSSYVPGAATVPLTAALAYEHRAGTQVSALPPAVRQAVILLTSALIKRRGGESLVLASINDQPSRKTIGEDGMTADEEHAYRILNAFRRAR